MAVLDAKGRVLMSTFPLKEFKPLNKRGEGLKGTIKVTFRDETGVVRVDISKRFSPWGWTILSCTSRRPLGYVEGQPQVFESKRLTKDGRVLDVVDRVPLTTIPMVGLRACP